MDYLSAGVEKYLARKYRKIYDFRRGETMSFWCIIRQQDGKANVLRGDGTPQWKWSSKLISLDHLIVSEREKLENGQCGTGMDSVIRLRRIRRVPTIVKKHSIFALAECIRRYIFTGLVFFTIARQLQDT